MIQNRRLTALLVGAWLGASVLTDIAVTQNFQTVDRFLQAPHSATAAAELDAIGRQRERALLRRNAGEENNWIFLNWERAEIALGALIFGLMFLRDRPKKPLRALCFAMLLIVGAEHFVLTPWITGLGRQVDELPPTAPATRQFWLLHGLYSGLDILKMLLGLWLAARLVIRRKPHADHIVHEYARSLPDQGLAHPATSDPGSAGAGVRKLTHG